MSTGLEDIYFAQTWSQSKYDQKKKKNGNTIYYDNKTVVARKQTLNQDLNGKGDPIYNLKWTQPR